MEPVSMILIALASGAGTAFVQGTTGEAAKDAYNTVKTLVVSKFKGNAQAELILKNYEQNPEVWQKPLETELKQVSVEEDKELVQAAEKVVEEVDPEYKATKGFNIHVQGNATGFAIGSKPVSNITNNYNRDKDAREQSKEDI